MILHQLRVFDLQHKARACDLARVEPTEIESMVSMSPLSSSLLASGLRERTGELRLNRLNVVEVLGFQRSSNSGTANDASPKIQWADGGHPRAATPRIGAAFSTACGPPPMIRRPSLTPHSLNAV